MRTSDHGAASAVPRADCAGTFLSSLAAQDFAALGSALTPDASLRALLPSGLRERTGAGVISEQFARWFGDTQDFELVDGAVGEVGDRVHLSWRLRLRAERLGTGCFIVEQQAYADTGDDGCISRMDLLCTGYRPEVDDG